MSDLEDALMRAEQAEQAVDLLKTRLVAAQDDRDELQAKIGAAVRMLQRASGPRPSVHSGPAEVSRHRDPVVSGAPLALEWGCEQCEFATQVFTEATDHSERSKHSLAQRPVRVKLDIWRCVECGQLYEVGRRTWHDPSCPGSHPSADPTEPYVPLEPVAIGTYLRIDDR